MPLNTNFYQSIDSVISGLTRQNYIINKKAATAVFLAGRLGKPLLIEGPAGVGKTGLAEAVAGALNTELFRLQCYPGLDESKTLYEWNYQKQLLHIQAYKDEVNVFSPAYLLERPLLKAFRSPKPAVLLIDEIDKGEEELESFLLEALSEYQVSIPELGVITAVHRPYVVLTSNSTRQLSDALKRRCIFLYLSYPEAVVEEAIVNLKVPGISRRLCSDVVKFVQELRKLKLKKAPSITESIDWARTLLLLGRGGIDAALVSDSLNVLLKYEEDIARAELKIEQMIPDKPDDGAQGILDTSTTVQRVEYEHDLTRFDF
ncbi:AAA family ATPase [Desulfotruncus alcoholivorax]|uniref:AAA family ATPase n=1 Tax=Desulfotruncus alcoholivorax TaxID=265477 RepID=UPI0004244A0B|nr:MoxR family ATPase [Desulfotruncus alcoholivorax]